MPKTILVAFMVLFLSALHGQTHNTNCMRCKISKNYIGNLTKEQLKGTALDECGCAACAEKDKKEREAKQAEDKRRDDARAAANKVKYEAEQKRLKAEREELLAKNKSTEVLINAQPESATGILPKPAPLVKTELDFSKKDNSKSKLFPLNAIKDGKRYGMILNQNGDTIVNKKGSDFITEVSDWKNVGTYLFKKRVEYVRSGNIAYNKLNILSDEIPVNAVIITLNDYSMNVMDSKGNLLFDETGIKMVYYCGNDFFVYFTCDSPGSSSCFQNDYYYAGSKMVVYDNKLKKKYIFLPPADVDHSLHLNSRYQISTYKSDQITDNFLFYWVHIIDTGNDEGGYIITGEEHIKIDTSRKPVMLTTIRQKSSFWR